MTNADGLFRQTIYYLENPWSAVEQGAFCSEDDHWSVMRAPFDSLWEIGGRDGGFLLQRNDTEPHKSYFVPRSFLLPLKRMRYSRVGIRAERQNARAQKHGTVILVGDCAYVANSVRTHAHV